MLKRFAALAFLTLTAAGPAPVPSPPEVRVAVTTSAGTITLAIDAEHAPLTAANFLRYVDQKRFDGTSFYRSMHLDWGTPPNGLIQGGTQNDPKRILRPVAHEPTSRTGILHKRGVISMARFAPGTATGDFSIMVADQPGLDADPAASDADTQAGFAAFGHVVEGMDVVDAIWGMPRSATKGVGVMKGQILESPVRIVRMRRVAVPVSATAPSAAKVRAVTTTGGAASLN